MSCFEGANLPLKARPFPLSRVRLLSGPFKERQEVHRRFLLMVEPDRMLAPFRLQAGLPPKAERYGGWESRDISGHSLGHYLSALSLLYASTSDKQLLKRIFYIVDELAECQHADPDGYVLPVDKKAFQELREGKIDASPFALNGVWVPHYTLHKVLAGLRDAYLYARCKKALEVEQKLVAWLQNVLSCLNETQIQEMLRTEHGGMNEVLADLSYDTGNADYLRMACDCFHHRSVIEPMLRGEDKLDGLHGNTQIPKVVGLAREYELSGLASYRKAAESFWENVVRRRSYANGGHGESEHFFPPGQFPAKLTPYTAETCNSYNMLKLTGHLFSWEPKAEQMDFVERTMINHLLANIGRQPGEFGYFLGLGSVGVKAFSTPFDSWWCCVGTGMENPTRYGEQIYFHNEDSLWVNLYIASQLAWAEKDIEIEQQTLFPESDAVQIRITAKQPVRVVLKLRRPYWCERPEIKINGEAVGVSSEPSLYFMIDRNWQDGDVIDLKLPMTLRLEPLPYSGRKTVALMYGPVLLAGVVPDKAGIANPAKERFCDHLSARGKTDAFPPVLVAASESEVLSRLLPLDGGFAEFRSNGLAMPEDLRFVPFHRIYEEQYAVYFPVMTGGEWAERQTELREEFERRVRWEAATLDSVASGFQQPEVEHGLKSEKSEVCDFQSRKAREAHNGGWFSYALAVDPVERVVLIVTYWGGEWDVRHFDIVVDGEKIATQRLRTNKPGDFFDEIYPIAPELTKGKAKITVQFQAHPGNKAGRVFALRVMRAAEFFSPLTAS